MVAVGKSLGRSQCDPGKGSQRSCSKSFFGSIKSTRSVAKAYMKAETRARMRLPKPYRGSKNTKYLQVLFSRCLFKKTFFKFFPLEHNLCISPYCLHALSNFADIANFCRFFWFNSLCVRLRQFSSLTCFCKIRKSLDYLLLTVTHQASWQKIM